MLSLTFLFITVQALTLVSRSYQECYDVDQPEHGSIRIHDSHAYYQVVCEHGYILQGNPTVYCVNNEWDSPPPTCVGSAQLCRDLPEPENGIVTCDEGPLTVGKACNFECNDGYELRGVRVKTCMLNHQWSGPTTRCIPITTNVQREYTGRPVYASNPCQVNKGGCQHLCSLTREREVFCSCREGYSRAGRGLKNCIKSEEQTAPSVTCDVDNGGCEHNCDDSRATIQCSCQKGYMLHFDRKHCVDINECSSGNLNNCEHYCNNTNGSYSCYCKPGYVLKDGYKCEEILTHEQNGEVISGRRDVRTPHKASSTQGSTNLRFNPGHPCFNNQCDQFCRIEKGRAQCRCNKGYILNLEDQRSCKRSPCLQNNGGCEHDCSLTPERTVNCSCRAGYSRAGKDLKSCIRNEARHAPAVTCEINNGGCEHHCKIRWTTVQCSCWRGYMLHSDGKHCVDIDECSVESFNKCQHYCQNTRGSFVCFCKPGYILLDGYKCEGCGKNSYMSSELKGCVECPENSHANSEGKTSIRDCVCDPGFVGNPGDGIRCEDINECRINNFDCSNTCVNIPGSAFCSCPVGFTLNIDNKTCIDMDECSIKNGGCEGFCLNLNGSFRCSCPEGYVLSNKDQYSCDDVDECQNDNGGCEQTCINYRGGYYCSCRNGYRLDSGLKNCTEIQCPLLPVPPYSHMVCKNNGENFEERENYPIGTVCAFYCDRGFKNAKDSKRMVCQEDGTWEGTLPMCRVQHCNPLKVPENGAVHPPFCSTRGNSVKQRCTFTCNPGYKLEGNTIFQCKNNLSWNHEEIPSCQPEKIQPTIKCHRDITEMLLPGKNAHNITLQEPTTNVESYEVHPEWVSTDQSIEFPAGVTKVVFTASSPNSNKTAKCVVTVTVLDEEPPAFDYCPDPIKIEDASADGEFVTWREPVVTDNVEVESLFSILEPNTTLTPGTYVVEYIARDNSGNTASCSFDISIIRVNCSDLIDPAHGEANCVDWMFGKFCQPQCEAGYMRNPDDPLYYACDDSGVWEPAEIIGDCLQFIPATSSTCPDGFELKTNNGTSEEVCIECPSNTAWSTSSRKCEETTK